MRAFFKKWIQVFNAWSAWGRVGFLLVCAVLITVFVFVGSNLWLSSSWGCDTAARHLKQRTGLDWEVGSASWSPWNGFIVNNVKLLQPEELQDSLKQPLVSVEKMQVKPYWRKLLKGKVELSEVLVDQPDITVSIEMLVAMASQYRAPLKAAKPLVTKPKSTGGKTSQKEVDKQVSKPLKKAEVQPKSKKPAKKVIAQRPPVGLPVWLKVNDAKLKVISISQKLEFLSLSGLSLDTPVFGEDSEGWLEIGELRVSDQLLVDGVKQKIQWQRPFLKIQNNELELLGLDVQQQSQLMMRRGSPKATGFKFTFNVKPQPLDELHLLERFGMVLDADQVAGVVKGMGAVFNPLSWRGSVLLDGTNFHVKERHGGHRIEFDEVYAPAVLNRGQLKWSGLRAIGDDISILGNGGLSSSGEVLAVTRLVASPEVAAHLQRAMFGAMIPNVTRSWWGNLDTPDRKMRDVILSGHMSNPMVDITRKHEFVPLKDIVNKTKSFITREMKEEGKVLQPSSNHEMFKSEAHENH